MAMHTNKDQTFEIKEILTRVITVLDEIIDTKIMPKTTFEKSVQEKKKKKNHKSDFLNKEIEMSKFPFTKSTYYTYSSYINAERHSRKITDISLSTIFDVCKYADVSADYLLGFNDTQRKEPSAEQMKIDFGLSDTAMKNLRQIHQNQPETKGEVSSEIVNIILESQDFWERLNAHLPIYLSNLSCSRADIDVNVARYGLSRVFEDLIDEICNKLQQQELPLSELDETTPFGS